MATLLPENVPPPDPHLFDAIAIDIENRYERIVNVVRERKRILLTQLAEFREEYDTLLSNRDRTERELKSTKKHIEILKENDLRKMQEKFISEIEKKQRNLKISTANYSIQFVCESKEFEKKLSTLGELIKFDSKLTNYSEIDTPTVAVGKNGRGKDKFNAPRGIAFDEETQLIYVCDMFNSCVKVVSVTGEFIGEFGSNELVSPWGILLFKESIYVTDIDQCAIFQFHSSTRQILTKVGERGLGKGDFDTPRSLTIASDGDLYVAEHNNNRISVLDVNLEFKLHIHDKMIISPQAVLFTNNHMLILCDKSPYCVHFFSLQSKYVKSIISIESQSWAYFFCIDRANNILVCNSDKNSIQVYSEKGKLLYTIGNGQLDWPCGLTTTSSGKLILVSQHKDHGLQIF